MRGRRGIIALVAAAGLTMTPTLTGCGEDQPVIEQEEGGGEQMEGEGEDLEGEQGEEGDD